MVKSLLKLFHFKNKKRSRSEGIIQLSGTGGGVRGGAGFYFCVIPGEGH